MAKHRSPLLAATVALVAAAFILTAGPAFAAAGPAELASLGSLAAVGAGAGVARLAACAIGPRIFFDRPNEGGAGGKTAEQLAGEVKAAFDRSVEAVKAIAEEALGKAKSGEELSSSLKEKADEALLKLGEVSTRMGEVEQKLARRGSGDEPQARKTIGQLVVDHDEFKNGSMGGGARKSMRVSMSRKDILNVTATTGAGTSTTNSLVVADRVPGIVTPANRPMRVRDLLMPGETASNNVEYVKEAGFVNNAAPVAEGAPKPKSDLTFNMEGAPVRTIAHIFKASRQILDDAPQLRTYIDARAQYGLQFREEVQLLSGDGTGQNIKGLLPHATDYAAAFAPVGEQAIDRLRLGMLQVMLAEYPASGFILHPTDWAKIELTKDGEGRYIVGNPADGTGPRLWGQPVVPTQAMPVNNWLTGAFNLAAQIFDRMEIEVLLSTENVDDFEHNMVTIRAEERLALAVYRPEAFVNGNFTFS